MLKLKEDFSLAQAKYGLSLSWSGLDSNALSECLGLPGIEAAGIQVDSLSADALSKLRSERHGFVLHAGRLLDQSVSENILYAPQKMREAFAEKISALLMLAKTNGFACASLDIGLEQSLADSKLRQTALELFRRMIPALLKSGVKLALPCRVPSLSRESYPGELALFIKDCMVPGLKVSLELHPHELQQGFDPAPLIKGLEFDIASVILMYNADNGTLVKAHIEPWVTMLLRYGFKGPYLACPKSGAKSRLPAECISLAKLLSGIRKNG